MFILFLQQVNMQIWNVLKDIGTQRGAKEINLSEGGDVK